MWAIIWFASTLAVIYYAYWINKWRNPKRSGSLPPGSMGLPLIGETLQLLTPSYSLDLHPFIKKRIKRYGLIFRSNVAGRPLIISADPEFNRYIIKQEGNLVEMWYLDTFSKLFAQDGEIRTNAIGLVHKYARSLFLNHFGAEILKEKLLPEMEVIINKTLRQWSNHASVEVKHAASLMILNFTAKQAFGYDFDRSPNISESFAGFLEGLMSFPLNLPGTAYHKCMEDQKKVMDFLRQELEERLVSPNKHHKDVLGQAVDDLKKEKFLSPELIVKLLFGALFASFESISAVITLAFKLLSEHPLVMRELVAEHDRILKNRNDRDASLTWDEYRSMTFTSQVINEILRLGNVAPGLLRRAMKDFEYKGYTIPAGWPIMVVTAARHMNPDVYENPLVFNPWRWKDLDSYTISCNFTPFGGGIRQCAGAEYSKAFLATFFHVLVTKYKWIKTKGGQIARSPTLGFRDGVHIIVCERH